MTETATLTPNVPLIRAVLAQINAHPELHSQQDFDCRVWGGDDELCGTAHCFAGWAVVLSPGYRYDAKDRVFRGLNDEIVSPDETAKRLLGITEEAAWGFGSTKGLFAPSRSRNDLAYICERIVAPTGETL